MDYLKQFITEANFSSPEFISELKQELVQIHGVLRSIISKIGLVKEEFDPSKGMEGDIKTNLATAVSRFEAARRALGIISKLPPGEERGKHASRIMSNMNKLRSLVSKLTKQVEQEQLGESADLATLNSKMIVRNKKVIPFKSQDVLRKMGYRFNTKRTEECAKMEDDNLYSNCEVFTKKDEGTYYVNSEGWVLQPGKRKFTHPLLCPAVQQFLHSQGALDFIPVEGQKVLIDPRPSVFKRIGIRCETT